MTYNPETGVKGQGAKLKVYDLKGAIPFSGDFTAQKPAVNNRHRLGVFRRFFGWGYSNTTGQYQVFPPDLKVLDIARTNFISRHLGITHNTQGDLNKGISKILISEIRERTPENPKKEDNLYAVKTDIIPSEGLQYDIITSFEVFSHVMNPLQLTQECYRLLKPGGRLFLSTPLLWGIVFEHGKGNWTEYKKDRIQIIHEYCGFKPIRYQRCNPWPFRFIFYGARPPARWLLNKFQLWEFEKVTK